MSLISGVLGFIVKAVFGIEKAQPQPGNGPVKKAVVLAGVEALVQELAVDTGLGPPAEVDEIVSLAGEFIDQLVAVVNKYNGFKKGT